MHYANLDEILDRLRQREQTREDLEALHDHYDRYATIGDEIIVQLVECLVASHGYLPSWLKEEA